MHTLGSPPPAREPSAARSLLIRGIAALWDGSRLHRDAAVLCRDGRFTWVGRDADRPPADGEIDQVIDAGGAIGMPGLVDCHTHTTFAGSRADDFTRRLAGETYAQILEAGGGIHSTVRATRAASEAELTALTRARLSAMAALGVTTVEVKSGYGLHLEPELRMLRAARAAEGPVRVVLTYLAHVLPPELDRSTYVDAIVAEHLPAVAGLVDAVDVYCDRGAFTLAETGRIFEAAGALGLRIRVHAEQIEHTGVARLAAERGATSADHLERLDDDGIAAMARAGTVAVLLPAAMVYLRDIAPPVAKLRAAGVPLAVATDFNPGSSPAPDLWAAATLACLTMGLTVEEALAGITRVAALALGRPDLGRVEVGAVADLALYRPPPGEPADVRVLVQYLGGHRAERVVRAGQP